MPSGAECGRWRRRLRAAALSTLALLAGGLALDAGWIHAKALLAQQLLQQAFDAESRDGRSRRPWPWADTRPVARLLQPRLGIRQIVVAGDSGRSLAFGPGWAEASVLPGAVGTAVVSGHRDTHFAWLQALQVGDRIAVERGGQRREYRIDATEVVDSRRQRIAIDGGDRLLLVTCWPFDAVVAGGPQRYVVSALPCDGRCSDRGHSAQAAPPGAG
jgi:sortase A